MGSNYSLYKELMAQGIYIDAKDFNGGVAALKKLFAQFPDRVDDVLQDNAEEIRENAIRRAPANNGSLRQNISIDISRPLKKTISSKEPYSAYVEFGTGAYAAAEVSKLPPQYRTYAAQFKTGNNKRTIKGMLFFLMQWFKRKGITDKQHQYFIARKIVRDGTHPHPFMLPALFQQKDKIIADLKNLMKKLKV